MPGTLVKPLLAAITSATAAAANIGYCTWPSVESSHDFGAAIKTGKKGLELNKKTQKNIKFKILLTNALNNQTVGTAQVGCKDFTTYDVFDEDEMVKHVLGYDKAEINSFDCPAPNLVICFELPIITAITSGAQLPTKRTMSRATGPPNSTHPVFTMIKKGPGGVQFTGAQVLALFANTYRVTPTLLNPHTDANTNPNEHVFLHIDVGQDVILLLKGLSLGSWNTTKKLGVHIIHTPETMADSANGAPPNSKRWDEVNAASLITLTSWQYYAAIGGGGNYGSVTAENHSVFLSNYKITTVWNPVPLPPNPVVYSVKQTWRRVGFTHTFDVPSKDNAAPSISTRVASNYAATDINSILAHATVAEKDSLSFNLQTKRAGDWLQMIATSEFPTRVLADRTTQVFLHKNGNHYPPPADKISERCTIVPTTGPLQAEYKKWYKDRTFILTGDWPAFCYAAFNRINCILVCKKVVNGEQPSVISLYFQD